MKLQPLTVRFIIVSIDGEGARGVIPLEFLSQPQNVLSAKYPI